MAVWCKSNAFVVKLLRFWNCIFFNVKNGCILGLNDNVGVGKFSSLSMFKRDLLGISDDKWKVGDYVR